MAQPRTKPKEASAIKIANAVARWAGNVASATQASETDEVLIHTHTDHDQDYLHLHLHVSWLSFHHKTQQHNHHLGMVRLDVSSLYGHSRQTSWGQPTAPPTGLGPPYTTHVDLIVMTRETNK